MTERGSPAVPEAASRNRRLAILLAMAMFVLVVDTSLMNVSIASVVRDLDTTVSGVQSAIALEALVSAAFILIGSRVGDLIGRKRAYVLGAIPTTGRHGASCGAAFSSSSILTYSAVARVSKSASTGPPGSTLGSQRRSWAPSALPAPLESII